MNNETPQKKQFSEKLVKIFGQKILEADGFAPIAGSFLLYQKELGLTNGEIVLIAKVFYFSLLGKVEILDKELNPSSNNYNYQRKTLRNKGYLTTTVINRYIDNVPRNCGVVYDFSGLLKTTEQLIEEKAKIKKVEKDTPKSTEVIIEPKKEIQQVSTNELTENETEYLKEYNVVNKKFFGKDINFVERASFLSYTIKDFRNYGNGVDYKIVLTEAAKIFGLIGIEKRKRVGEMDRLYFLVQKISVHNYKNDVKSNISFVGRRN